MTIRASRGSSRETSLRLCSRAPEIRIRSSALILVDCRWGRKCPGGPGQIASPAAGARIRQLTIDAPYGATIRVHCHGRSCPFRRMTRINARAKRAVGATATISIGNLRHRILGAGTTLRVFVSKPGVFGKYTLFARGPANAEERDASLDALQPPLAGRGP